VISGGNGMKRWRVTVGDRWQVIAREKDAIAAIKRSLLMQYPERRAEVLAGITKVQLLEDEEGNGDRDSS
jgi:hypothetical protein